MLTCLTKSGDKMNQASLAESMLNSVSGIARDANALLGERVNQSEMIIFHLLTSEEAENGNTKIQLSQICRELGVSRPAVTQCVDRLVSRELLVRCSDPTDRRAVYVELTDKGREYFSTVKGNATDMINRIISRMGEENALQLTQLMAEMRNALKTETKLMRT